MKDFFISLSISVEVKVKLTRSDETKKIELEKDSTVEDLLKKLDLKPDTLIVLENNKPIPVDSEVYDGQELTIMQVSSGG